ncbi:MAG: hypothetical protein QOE80_3967 [Actinomycetota bacterium]|nr:hypothetical protein [Actinomycetota bacterium]
MRKVLITLAGVALAATMAAPAGASVVADGHARGGGGHGALVDYRGGGWHRGGDGGYGRGGYGHGGDGHGGFGHGGFGHGGFGHGGDGHGGYNHPRLGGLLPPLV